jgi:hypothetical protein
MAAAAAAAISLLTPQHFHAAGVIGLSTYTPRLQNASLRGIVSIPAARYKIENDCIIL